MVRAPGIARVAAPRPEVTMGSLGPLAGMLAPVDNSYQQRKPGETVLWQTVQAEWLTFKREAAAPGSDRNIPGFVEKAVERFLDCGFHSAGFARVRCTSCKHDLLVAFSCKSRGICPSCDGRRMAEQAANLVDHVIPRVHVRQWVLTLPFWLRYRVAWDTKLFSEVIGVWIKTVTSWYRARAKADYGIGDGQCASASGVQRFGDGLRLNPHVHSIFADGIWHQQAGEDRPVFVKVRPPKQADVQKVAMSARRRIIRRLARMGVLKVDLTDPDCDPFAEQDPILAKCLVASILDRVAIGVHEGELVARLRKEMVEGKPRGNKCATADGFDVHAATTVAARNRDRLEQLARYILRPAICNARLERLDDGRIRANFKSTWRDGSTAKIFEGPDFIAKVIALIPAPRSNQLRFHGQWAPGARWRDQIVPAPPKARSKNASALDCPELLRYRINWAELMKRTFAIDVLKCDRCGGRRKLIALIKAGDTATKILDHLGMPSERPGFKRPPVPPGQPDPPEDEDNHVVLDEIWPDDIDDG